MSANEQFSRYRAMLTELASRGLSPLAPGSAGGIGRESGSATEQSAANGSAAGGPISGTSTSASASALSLSMAAPAARLLLRDDRADHAGLVAAFQLFADLGRPHLTVGVNVGTLASMRPPVRAASSPSQPPRVRQSPGMTIPGLCDEARHTRDVYFPFAVHLCLAAFHRRYESLPPQLWSACEQALLEAVAPLRTVEAFAGRTPPPRTEHLMLWHALCLAEQARLLQRDIDLETVDAAVHTIVTSGTGSLHPQHRDDSPDAWTWRELTGLHALANLALLRRNNAWARRVEEIALHHLEHTQPDNTTNQPWAVFAFLWSGKTRSFAEQQIHDATAQGVGFVSAMLLADAANALAEFAGGSKG